MKEILQKNIERKAQNRIDEEIKKINDLIEDSPLTRYLFILNKEGEEEYLIGNNGFSCFVELFSQNGNFEEIKEKLLEKYKQEEEDNLFKKLDSLESFFRDRLND